MKAIQELLNESECLGIVRKALDIKSAENIEMLQYKIERGSNDLVGFMGEYYKLKVEVRLKPEACTKQLQYFLKSVPITNEFHRDECERKGFFGKETRIYTDILPNIQKYASSKLFPACYYTRSDLIVLEDLFAAEQKFSHLSPAQYTINHHKLMLNHHAKLHAASIAWEVNENVQIGEQFNNILFEMQLTMKNEWFVTGIKGIVYLAKMHPKYQSAAAQKFINEQLYSILSNADALIGPSSTLRNVFCHRDSWSSNIFFSNDSKGNPNDCRIVDFQLSRYSPPAIDVLFLLYTTCSVERRLEIFDECMNHYYESLGNELAKLNLSEQMISKADFLRGLYECRLPILIIWAICEPLMKMPEGLANKWRAEESELFDYYMNTQRDEMFDRIMAIDKQYRETIMLPIEELIECIFELEAKKSNIII